MPPRYFPYPAGAHRHTVGARTLDPATWIEFGADADGQLEAKRDLLTDRHASIVGVLDGPPGPGAAVVGDACEELFALLSAHLAAVFPERFPAPPRRRPQLHAIDDAARLVPEDLCLHLPGTDGRPILVAASVAFPSGWSLAEKLGRPIGQIHQPVPGYGASIERPVDQVMDALKPGRGLWRLNGSLYDDAELFRPVSTRRTTPSRIPEDVVLRVERQTLRRLPESGAVVFTIRTYLDPLLSIADDPVACASLAGWLRGMPDDQREYKQLSDLAPAVLTWLEARTA